MYILVSMDIILTCQQCGHEEFGNSERSLITRVRMLNHLSREHPEMAEVDGAFKDLVAEDIVETRGAA